VNCEKKSVMSLSIQDVFRTEGANWAMAF